MNSRFVDFIRKTVAPYHYPQYIFARHIIKELTGKNKLDVIVDAPCGNGETAFLIAKSLKRKVYAYDISEKCISTAKNNFKNCNVHFEQLDIINLGARHEKIDVWCIINSLFLFSNAEEILKLAHNLLDEEGWLVLILPNIHSRNYRNFMALYGNVNAFTLQKDEFREYFIQRNFIIYRCCGIVYADFYGRKELKFLSVFAHFYLISLDYVKRFLNSGEPSYYLLILKKAN